jgi:hypothetical protein
VPIRPRTHRKLALLGLATWFVFWLGGLPDYYQQYSFRTKVIASIALVPLTFLLGWRSLSRLPLERRKAMAIWLAFYFTVPFAIADALYCGWYLGHGVTFVTRYWYLSIFYVIPWIVFIPIGLRRTP